MKRRIVEWAIRSRWSRGKPWGYALLSYHAAKWPPPTISFDEALEKLGYTRDDLVTEFPLEPVEPT